MAAPDREVSLDGLIQLLDQRPGAPHPCPYLPDREARVSGFSADSLDPVLYHRLMDRGFRRSGTFFYRPACTGCRECVPIRLPVGRFRRTHSQDRVWRKNRDLFVRVGQPECTRARWELFARYLRSQHDGTMSSEFEDFERFLYTPCVHTLEFTFFLGRRLVAASLADVSGRSLSSVYCYFEPEQARRSLGTYSVLREIEYAREQGIPHYYLGYHVWGCASMSYKLRFGPHELLRDYERWEAGTAVNSRQD